MIRVVILLDADAPKIGDWKREMQAVVEPADYVLTDLRCTGWGRRFKTGAVELRYAFTITTPPGVLPIVDIYGGVCPPAPIPAPTPKIGRPRKRR